MIQQQARVTHLEGGRVTVTMQAVSGCPACDAGEGCGAGIFGRLLGRKPLSLQLAATAGLRPGQAVTVAIPETLFLQLLARLYLWPLLAGLAGAVAGHYLALAASLQGLSQDLLALLGALILAAVTLHIQRTGNDRLKSTGKVQLLPCPAASPGDHASQYCRRPSG